MTLSAIPTRYQPITRCCSASAGPYRAERMVAGMISVVRAGQRVLPVTEPADARGESSDRPDLQNSYGTFGGSCVPEPEAAAFVIAAA
jgi:hypothetical protein